MPTRYETTRDKIAEILLGVTGIGLIYKSPKYASDWENWISLHKDDASGLVKVGWFSLVAAPETPLTIPGVEDGALDDHYQSRTETWSIEQFLGFKDDTDNPSDYAFQLLAERIEEQFRFQQNLGGVCYESRPLSRKYSGPWMLGNIVLVHRAQWDLTLIHQIKNPNPD